MAFVWVQQWIALPVVVEELMGDLPSGPSPQALDMTAVSIAHESHQGHVHQSPTSLRSPGSNTPFYSQLCSIPQSLHHDFRSPAHAAHSTSPHYSQDHGATPLNMGAMAGALPEYVQADGGGGQPQLPQRQLSGASTSALVYQLQQNLQVQGQNSNALPMQSGYGPGFAAGQFQHNYMPTQASAHPNYAVFSTNQRGPGHGASQAPYQNYPHQPPYLYYPAPYGTQPFAPGYAGQNAQGQAMYGRSQSTSSHVALPGQGMDMSQQDGTFPPGHRPSSGGIQGDPGAMGWMSGGQFMQPTGKFSTASTDTRNASKIARRYCTTRTRELYSPRPSPKA